MESVLFDFDISFPLSLLPLSKSALLHALALLNIQIIFSKEIRMTQKQRLDRRLNPIEAAAYINWSVKTLATFRSTKKYDLKPVKEGRKIYYLQSVLDRHLADRLIKKKK